LANYVEYLLGILSLRLFLAISTAPASSLVATLFVRSPPEHPYRWRTRAACDKIG